MIYICIYIYIIYYILHILEMLDIYHKYSTNRACSVVVLAILVVYGRTCARRFRGARRWVPLPPVGSRCLPLGPVASLWVPLPPIGSHCLPLGPIASHWVLLPPIGSYCIRKQTAVWGLVLVYFLFAIFPEKTVFCVFF